MAEYQGMEFEAIDYKTDISESLSTKELLDFDYYIACAKYPDKNKIYVALQSEHIFRKTTSDICQKVGNSCQIILRGDKQFFEPEVEND